MAIVAGGTGEIDSAPAPPAERERTDAFRVNDPPLSNSQFSRGDDVNGPEC